MSSSKLVNDRTTKNRVRPNPEASAISTEASAEASAEPLPINTVKNVRFFKFLKSNCIYHQIVLEFQLVIFGYYLID